MNFKILLTFFVLLSGFFGNAQITVNGGYTAQQLAEILAGSNVTVSNAVISGPSTGYGSFASSTGFVFPSGVILSNGFITNAVGPNNDPNTSDNLGGAGTAEMTALGGANSYDVITLEFDFIVQSSSIQFSYIFASEEYPEFAPPNNPSFNDVFAFYISGPGITGQENVALIPSTSTPVSINTVNAALNTQYYVDNIGGQEIQFDGYTTDLIATRTGLTPCSTYHIRLVLSDIQTSNRNSAVFLKENSFVQENVLGGETQTINSDGIALEGCVDGSFAFAYSDISAQDRTINFTIGGTAVNGVDYAFLDNYITIPAGETEGTVFINAFSDGLLEGAETVTLTYTSGVCIGTETVTLTINDSQPISFTLDGTNLDCFEDNSGEILVNATGGFPAYTYVVTDPNGITTNYTANPVTGLPAGQYSVQVNDTYGCKAEALVIGGQFNAGTTFLPDGNGVTYEAPLVIAGFNPGQTITNVNQIQQVCLTMEHSYLGDLWIRVESPSGQTVTLKQQNGGASCDLGEPIATGPVDGNNADITPGIGYEYCFNANPTYNTMVNESANFTRNYTDGVGNNYSDNYLPAGSYTPSGNFSSLVGSPMNGTWKVFVTDQFGQDNGYIFNWYISLIGDLPDTIVVLTQPESISISGIAANATCGSSNGSINVSVLNGVAPVSYSWSNGAVTEDISNLSAGQYTVTATDGNGCVKTKTFLVNNIGTLAISSTVIPVTCFGGSDGSISITPSGGSTPYSFLWSNGATTQNISGISAGIYTVTMTDQIGCVFSDAITVGQNVQINPVLTSSSDELCNTTNGSINITVNGGNGSYGFSWSNGSTSEDLSNLNSGNYSVTVTDGLGCSNSANFSIANNLTGCSNFCYIDVAENTILNSTCGAANGSININILNAVAPYTIQWSTGALTEDISSLVPGVYSVTVSDANNCSETSTFTVGNNANGFAISSSSITDETCGNSNGAIDVTLAGGNPSYTFNWSNGSSSQNIQGLTAGTYTLTATDANGCIIDQSFSVVNNAGSLNVTGQTSSAICNVDNGSIIQTISGANGSLTYLWSNGAITQNISNIAPGIYSCTITDASSCSVTNSYTVGQNTGNVALTGTLVTNEICNNNQGAINITVTGSGLTYFWSNGATSEDLTGLSAGNYSCTATNASGCSVTTGSITVINSPGTLVVSNQSVTDALCGNNGGAVDVNIFGGQAPYTYLWSNGITTQDLTSLSAGIYTLQISDNNGCSLAHSVTIDNSPGTLAISASVLTHESCIAGVGTNGQGAINLSVTGGSNPITYLWSNGATTQDLTNLTDGNYSVTINSFGGCSLTQSFTILSNGSNIAITSSSVSNESCGSGTGEINLTMSNDSGPYSYSWSNGDNVEDIANLSAGAYTLTVSNVAGCSVSQSFTVGNEAGTLATTAIVTDETCGNQNGAINLSVSGGSTPYNYSWSNSSLLQDLSGLAAGTYSVIVSDLYGCSSNYTGSIVNITNGLAVSITSVTDEICGQGNGAVDATITGTPLSYSWSNGDLTEDLVNVDGGTYVLTVTDNLGCSASASAIVPNQTGSLAISFSNVQNETCGDAQGFIDVEVSGSPIFTYLWSNLVTNQDLVSLSSGTYSLTVSDGLGCELTQSFIVGNTNLSNISSSSVITDAYCTTANGAIDLTVTSGILPFTYSWSNGGVIEDISGLAAGTYSVIITDGANCQTTQNVIVGSQNSGLGFTFIDINNEFCNFGNGSIVIYTGGTADDYFIDGVNNGGPTIDPLSSGTYLLTITDDFGCSVNSTVTLGNDAFFNVINTHVNASCGLSNGSINVSVNGGGGGGGTYTYLWSNGATTQDLNNIPAGTYTVTVTATGGPGGGGCSDQMTVIIDNEVDFEVTASLTDDYCGQGVGAIDQTIIDGVGMTFLWSNGATTEDLTAVVYGDYSCIVNELGGCTTTYNYTIQNGTSGAVLSQVSGNEVCSDNSGFVDLTITSGSGNFSFDWSNSATTEDLTGLSSGIYAVTVTDVSDACEFGLSVDIQNDITLFDGSSLVTNASCATCPEGAINIALNWSTSYTYNWSNGATTQDLTGLLPGTYSVVVTSSEGCDTTMNFTLLNTASIDELNASFIGMNIHPNPATTSFFVDFVLPINKEGEIFITDVIGKVVALRSVSVTGELLFETKNMKDGIYFVTLKSGNYSKMERVVISNE